MKLHEDRIFKKYAKNCGHCNQNTLLPYEYEWTCFSCGYNVNKRKHELSRIQRKKINFINKIKHADKKSFVFVLMYVKFMKVVIMIKFTKFYPQ